jgi:hypothetical protein
MATPYRIGCAQDVAIVGDRPRYLCQPNGTERGQHRFYIRRSLGVIYLVSLHQRADDLL